MTKPITIYSYFETTRDMLRFQTIMILWFCTQIQSMFAALHSKDSPHQIAGGFALGSLAGWVPFNILYTPLIILLLYLININTAFGLVGIAIITVFSFFLDPLAGIIGHFVLTKILILQPLWKALYNTPILPYTEFNNTVMMGSFILGLALLYPLYKLIFWAVINYRKTWQEKIEKTRFFKWLKTSKLITFIFRYRDPS